MTIILLSSLNDDSSNKTIESIYNKLKKKSLIVNTLYANEIAYGAPKIKCMAAEITDDCNHVILFQIDSGEAVSSGSDKNDAVFEEVFNYYTQDANSEFDYFFMNGRDIENIAFIEQVIQKNPEVQGLLYQKNKAKQLISNNIETIKKKKAIVLLDCDKTVSKDDTSEKLFVNLGIDYSKLKDIYFGDFYTPFQFYLASELSKDIEEMDLIVASQEVAKNLELNKLLLEDIRKIKDSSTIIWITSGPNHIWNRVLEKSDVPDLIFTGSNMFPEKFLITSGIKMFISSILRDMGFFVVSVGDSVSDFGMLIKSDQGYLVCQNHINKSVQDHILKYGFNLKQLSYNAEFYEGLQTAKNIESDFLSLFKD